MPLSRTPLAVIPAAGLGTRLAPATWAIPKELLPVGPYPMIQWSLEEIVQAEIPRVAVVVSPTKKPLVEFLLRWRRGRRIKLELLNQPRAIGLADAIMRAKPLAGRRPIALLLPDNIFFPYAGSRSALRQVLDAFEATGHDTTGVIRVKSTDAHKYGNAGLVCLSHRTGRLHSVQRLHKKRKGTLRLQRGQTAHKTFARAVLLPHFFEYLGEALRRNRTSDEVSALQTIVRLDGLSGVLLRGRGFDAGIPAGYAATLAYWASKAARK